MSVGKSPSSATAPSAQPLRWLRLGIIGFCLAVFVGHGVDTYRHIHDEREGVLRDATERAQALAVSLDEHLARTVQAVDLVLDAAVEKIVPRLGRENRDIDLSDVTYTLQDLQSRAPQLLILQFIDANGTVVSASTGPETLGLNVATRPFFRAHVENPSGRLEFSPPFIGRLTGRVYVPLSRRVENPDGTFAGVLVAGLSTEYLEDFYTRLLGANPATLSVVSPDGMLLARIPRRSGTSGRDMSGAPLFKALAHSPSGVLRLDEDEYGPDRLLAYRYAGALPYIVTAMIDESLLLSGWREQAGTTVKRAMLVFAALLALSAVLLVASYRVQRLTRELGASEERSRADAARLQDAIESLPDGFVLYDADDRLVMCNSKFREFRATTPISYQPGARFADILRASVAAQFPNFTKDEQDAWICKVIADRRNPSGGHRLSSSGGRWLRISERRTSDGGTAAIHVDITELKATQAEAEAARARMADWAEASNDWFWETNRHYRFRFMADSKHPDGSASHLLGQSIRDLACDAESEPEKWADHQATIQRREPFRDLIFRLRTRNGRIRVMSASGKPVFDDDGFVGYRGTARDVTEEVMAKESAARARNLLAEALEATEEGFAIWDADDRLVLCNSPFRRLHGVLADLYQPGAKFEDIVRHAVESGDVPNAVGREEELIAERMASHRLNRGVFESRLADGRWKRVKEYRMEDGGVVGVHIDVTEEKAREFELGELARRNALFFTAMSRSTSAMVIADVKRAGQPIIYVNPAFSAMTGYGDDDAIGQGIDFLYDTADDAAIGESLRRAIENRQPIEARMPARHRDGRRIYLDLRAGPVADPHGEVTHFILVQDDVTKRVEVDAERAALENQLRHSQKIEALGTLAGGIAHDINNTLVPIVALSKMALMGMPSENPQREPMQTILDASYRIRDLVSEILAFSRKDAPKAAPIEIQGVVGKAVRLLSATLRPNVVILQDLADRPIAVSADENQLVQVLMNLCTNAAHAIGTTPGRVTIRLDTTPVTDSAATRSGLAVGTYARLTVSDTGCGMDARTLQRIFEPFYTTKSVGEGTGLGLSVVHGIIANHRGRITVESTVGRGTTFTILLPVAAAVGDPVDQQLVA